MGPSHRTRPSLRFAREIVMNPIGANLWIWDSPVTDDVIRRRAPLRWANLRRHDV
ncbi:MAG: hypothetical protein AVDCRST_MAG87-2538 [uncultured Thermomicrobiales bacterium]|uniref:Uncharacterized protein n=1 Tax=uncultured Thermomicrobiales bacterium TaxID=1645740 RepID=A0A6J4VD53_9BACT|nr:MAG: hypothetical protein AVDCRST_MAG87-2538 [uncultured Thermomicrobiales bacterium]